VHRSFHSENSGARIQGESMALGTTTFWQKRRGWIVVAVLLTITIAAVVWFIGGRRAPGSVSAAAGTPTTTVIRGELVDTVELRGQIKPVRSSDLLAPSDSGDIQIVKLSKDGDIVHKGDAVIVLDPTPNQNILNQRRSDLRQAQAQVDDFKAKAKLLEEQDLTDLQKANYDVERAKLDVSQAEILSPIDGEEKKLVLADAEQATWPTSPILCRRWTRRSAM
jgi:multidrug efflux pump subunit AcrA (membrane-fusion protein)